MNSELFRQVEQLLDEALSLPPVERKALLAKRCGGNDELRQRVESLLKHEEAARDFLETPVAGLVGELVASAAIDSTIPPDMTDPAFHEPLVGRSIGKYRVESLVGRGGMGDVYLAIEEPLGREVVLKALPARFTADNGRLQRFALEAVAASSLNHPNILTIYGIGHVEDVHFIAAEYVKGQTLRSRLAEGRLTSSEAVDIGIGITTALAAAHSSYIIHRDIKPENIMIRPDGYVKVLDFGLAKLMERPDARAGKTALTSGMADSDPGMIVGTPRYMSPEQVRGSGVDGRSDVFSAGVVLYEMLTASPPFLGNTRDDLFASILRSEPRALIDLAPDARPDLQRIVSKALAKSVENRYQDVQELLSDLKEVRSSLEEEARQDLLSRTLRFVRRHAMAVRVLGVLLVAVILSVDPPKPPPGPDVRFSEVQSWKSERGEGAIDARFSHDGRLMAFTMLRNSWQGIWVKELSATAEPRLITSQDIDSQWPVWSPDDQQIAFVAASQGEAGIWLCPSVGGPATLLIALEGLALRTRSWSRDRKTIYYEASNNLFALDVATRTTKQLTHLQPQPSYRHFSLAPNEDRICYLAFQDGQVDIWISELDGRNASRITNDSEEDQDPVWHPDGKRIVYASNRRGAFQLCVAHIDGRPPEQVTVGTSDHKVTDISSDGKKLLDVGSRDDADIFAVDTNVGTESELTSGSNLELWPEASPDGRTIAYQSTDAIGRLLSSRVFVRAAGEVGPPTLVATNGFNPSWSPDGSRLAFFRFADNRFNIITLSLQSREETKATSDGAMTKLFSQLPSTKYGQNLSWSPDSARIAYCSRRSGAPNIWEVNADGSQQTQLTFNNDASLVHFEPVWSPDGSRIAYVTETRRTGNDALRTWSLCIAENRESRTVFRSTSLLRPCGWSASGKSLLVAVAAEVNAPSGYPMKVTLLDISVSGEKHYIGALESTYFWTLRLAPDRRSTAFVSNRGNTDNIWLSDLAGSPARRITSNSDTKLYMPTLAWAPNSTVIYIAKQTSMSLINLVDEFN